jgi:nitroreductase
VPRLSAKTLSRTAAVSSFGPGAGIAAVAAPLNPPAEGRLKQGNESAMPTNVDRAQAKERIEFLRGLRSIRSFKPDPIPREVMDDILEVARWSGSASNRQSWQIIVIEDKAVLQQLQDAPGSTARHLGGAAAGIAIATPHKAPELEAYDEGHMAERIMLAAAAHGVGSCTGWFTGPSDSWQASEAVCRILGVPEGWRVREAISLGYVDEERHAARKRPEQARLPMSELVHRGKWGSAG